MGTLGPADPDDAPVACPAVLSIGVGACHSGDDLLRAADPADAPRSTGATGNTDAAPVACSAVLSIVTGTCHSGDDLLNTGVAGTWADGVGRTTGSVEAVG